MYRWQFDKLTTEEKYSVRLKIATGKYEVLNDRIVVKINLDEEKDVEITSRDKRELSIDFTCWESIYKGILKEIQNVDNEHFIEAFVKYKEEKLISGEMILDKKFVKFYSRIRPEEIERDEVGRVWIDYEKQIDADGYIHDIENGCGIWVTSIQFMYNAMKATWRYGDSIMIVAPRRNCMYCFGENEIVGGEFDVQLHGSLDDVNTWYELKKILGNVVSENMDLDVKNKYKGAKEIYENYVIEKTTIEEKTTDFKPNLLQKIIYTICGRYRLFGRNNN